MKEKKLKIKSGKFFLYGKLDNSINSSSLVIIVHGFAGNIDEELYKSATKKLNINTYNVFRYNLYGEQEDARKLSDSTIKSQAKDLETIIKYFKSKKENKKIYIIGHSFAAPIIFCTKSNYDTLVLWDPTYNFSFLKKEETIDPPKFIKEKNSYILNWEKPILINKKLVLEIEKYPWNTIANNFFIPTMIISANSNGLESSRKYFKKLSTKKIYKEIKEASHYFDDSKEVRDLLFDETVRFFRNF